MACRNSGLGLAADVLRELLRGAAALAPVAAMLAAAAGAALAGEARACARAAGQVLPALPDAPQDLEGFAMPWCVPCMRTPSCRAHAGLTSALRLVHTGALSPCPCMRADGAPGCPQAAQSGRQLYSCIFNAATAALALLALAAAVLVADPGPLASFDALASAIITCLKLLSFALLRSHWCAPAPLLDWLPSRPRAGGWRRSAQSWSA